MTTPLPANQISSPGSQIWASSGVMSPTCYVVACLSCTSHFARGAPWASTCAVRTHWKGGARRVCQTSGGHQSIGVFICRPLVVRGAASLIQLGSSDDVSSPGGPQSAPDGTILRQLPPGASSERSILGKLEPCISSARLPCISSAPFLHATIRGPARWDLTNAAKRHARSRKLTNYIHVHRLGIRRMVAGVRARADPFRQL